MPKRLSQEAVDRYHREGWASPVPVLSPEEVRSFRAGLEAYEHGTGRPLDFPDKSKSYLLFDWADRIVHHPAVLDAVEDVIGPDILVFHTTMWIKEANQPAFVHWHQDGAYFFLEQPEQVTAWVALSEASELAGCMRVIPGSHLWGELEHRDDPGPNNMIRRGQGILDRFRDDEGVLMPLRAGEMSLHNTRTIHASGPNRNSDRRMGLGISYIPTRVRPVGDPRPSALLVRGTDRYGYYEPEARLQQELSPEARAAHARACDLFTARQNAGFRPAA